MTDVEETTSGQVDAVVAAAEQAFRVVSATDNETRARWLEHVATALEAQSQPLVEIAKEETHLPQARLQGEVARTAGQLRMFAQVVREGSYLEAMLDSADGQATPPRPRLRRMLVPLGPVAVYAASNFPFAFSVAGGDTASALAVGCPVVVKAHPAHPRLSRATAQVVSTALAHAGAPDGVFGLVEGHAAGVALVEHPAVAAAAFTGSLEGGRALFDGAAARAVPIPFYGELASINPVVVTVAADRARGEELAAGLAQSFQLGAGQFCTKPGLVFVPSDSRLESAVASHVTPGGHPMLSESIAQAFDKGSATLGNLPGVEVVAEIVSSARGGPSTRVFAAGPATFAANMEALTSEVFGPTTVLVRYSSESELRDMLSAIPGSLTGTIHAQPDDAVAEIVQLLTERCGRVLFGGWPTGVAVAWSQHHGGPYPSTTSIHTSVGATAVRRFQRPVVYQDAPDEVLPPALRDSNPWGVPRRVDGVLNVVS